MSKAKRRRFAVGTRVCYKDGSGGIGTVKEVIDLAEFGAPGEWMIKVQWPGATMLDSFGRVEALKYLKAVQPPRLVRSQRSR